MELIDKDALIAEINRLKDGCYKICAGNLDFLKNTYPEHYYSIETYDKILSFLDTIEVKELDLDEAARKWEDKVYLEKGWQDEYGTPHAPFSEIGNAFREGAKFMIKVQKGE